MTRWTTRPWATAAWGVWPPAFWIPPPPRTSPLDGFGIRYKYGLFRQTIEGGFQREYPDDWQRFGDPWSLRRGDERVKVHFAGQDVWAVPYDMPVIGYGGKTVNNPAPLAGRSGGRL